MTFNFYKKFGALKGYETEKLFSRGIRAGWSFNKMQSEAMKAGVSYRRIDMQYDYRLGKATFYAKSITTRIESKTFFEKYFEPTLKEHKWDSSKTTDFFRKGRLGMLDTVEELEEYEGIMKEVMHEYPEKYAR